MTDYDPYEQRGQMVEYLTDDGKPLWVGIIKSSWQPPRYTARTPLPELFRFYLITVLTGSGHNKPDTWVPAGSPWLHVIEKDEAVLHLLAGN